MSAVITITETEGMMLDVVKDVDGATLRECALADVIMKFCAIAAAEAAATLGEGCDEEEG